ncbi:MAG: sulfotransferase [Xanthomonadales bacterium]|nr:sulfotransferase [Xanthomonadales bacterium]
MHLDAVVARHRGHPEAWRLLGILHSVSRRPADAVNALRRALALRADDGLIHSDLGNAQAALGEIDAAMSSWRRAAALAPEQAMPWFNLGRQHQLRGESESAVQVLTQAVAVDARFLPARILLADALVHLGRFDAATAAYRAALTVHPACGDAWRGLANIKTQPLTDADREQLLALLHSSDTSENDRIAIGFALGKVEEDHGHAAEAYAALVQANAWLRRRAPWSEAALRQYVERVLALTRQLPKPPNPKFGAEVIFIVGLPRSGSTLLEQMLAAHPNVEGASELDDLGDVLQAESQRRRQPYPEWIAKASAQDWLRLGREYLKRTARWRTRKPRHSDKQPDNWKHVGVLRAMLPGAHIIDMRRDPLETAWSCFKQQFYQLPHFSCDFADIAAYLQLCERALDAWRGSDPQQVHVQHYEALVAEPEPQLRALLASCGLDFDARCLDYASAERSVRTASAAQVRQPLRRDTARTSDYGALLDPLRAALAGRGLRDA